MAFARWWWMLLGVAPLACGDESGQTGSASCSETTSCGCRFLSDAVLVRATVLTLDLAVPNARKGSFEIEEVLDDDPSLAPLVGRRWEGSVELFSPAKAEQSVLYSCAASDGWPEAGHQVLASIAVPHTDPFCYACDACADPCDAGSRDEILSLPSWIIAWDDPWTFGSQVLSTADVQRLTDPSACRAAFPSPPQPPCNDTPNSSDRSDCSLSRGAHPGGESAVWLLVLTAVAAARRARRGDGVVP